MTIRHSRPTFLRLQKSQALETLVLRFRCTATLGKVEGMVV